MPDVQKLEKVFTLNFVIWMDLPSGPARIVQLVLCNISSPSPRSRECELNPIQSHVVTTRSKEDFILEGVSTERQNLLDSSLCPLGGFQWH